MIEKIIGLAEHLTPLALIGAGGIGKTSIALTVLHDDRIKERFGDDRRFIRCDQFPASCSHLLNRLSEVIGAGVENPEDLALLRPSLSSREMIIFLANAEYILDPRGTHGREIYAIVEELSRFSNICLCITSRTSTVPPVCETLDIPTLSTEAAHDTFYRIYKNGRRSYLVNGILEQLDFHPLSISLLATVAHYNKWDADRLSREWERRRTGILHTTHDTRLAATIEFSLASPMFHGLGPDARGLLGIVAFFPQGIDEKNLEWLFPTISDRTNIIDNFCVLSLTYRSNGFVTMLAPLRDHLSPGDPTSSPLLYTTKDRYFNRLSVFVNPGEPGYEEARWITSEDVNVEHLLDIFTSVDASSVDVWDACYNFMEHIYWHKARLVVLGPKIEGLPDGHRSKSRCLFRLSQLSSMVGNYVEEKRLLVHALELWGEGGSDFAVAQMLRFISGADMRLGLHEEGIRRAKEALEIYKRLDHRLGQAQSLQELASLLYDDGQLDAAEEAALQLIDLLSGEGDQLEVCEHHHLLGKICRSKGQVEKATEHFGTALGIASSFNWQDQLFWNNYSLAELFFGENRSDDAHAHVERAKSHAVDDPYLLARAMNLQAGFWCRERRFEEAKSEALRALDMLEKLGATKDVEHCKTILQNIEDVSHGSDFNGEPPEMALLFTPVNFPLLVRGSGQYLTGLFRRILPRKPDPAFGRNSGS